MYDGDEIVLIGIDRPQKPLKVFLVEDSPLIRERLIDVIASTRDIEVVGCAETESEAVEKLSKSDCDAIVLDINLARGSGFQVLRSVRANRAHRPQVIVFTNYADSFYHHLTIKMGADFFLDKATDIKRLLKIIEGLSAADGKRPN